MGVEFIVKERGIDVTLLTNGLLVKFGNKMQYFSILKQMPREKRKKEEYFWQN